MLARRSEPPCFSVIAIPQVDAALLGGRDEACVVKGREQARLPLGGELGLLAQRGHAAQVIEIGQPWPPSACDIVMNAAALAACAPERCAVQGMQCSPCEIEASMKRW